MSSQNGNSKRTRAQKHQNRNAFKNNMHESNKRVLAINKKEVLGCCDKCTGVIEWKIQYKKYKPLTVPKKCVKCLKPRTILEAYHAACPTCAENLGICAKCCTTLGKSRKIKEPVETPETAAAPETAPDLGQGDNTNDARAKNIDLDDDNREDSDSDIDNNQPDEDLIEELTQETRTVTFNETSEDARS